MKTVRCCNRIRTQIKTPVNCDGRFVLTGKGGYSFLCLLTGIELPSMYSNKSPGLTPKY